MKLFRIRGGVHPDDRKHLAADQAIEDLPLAPLLHVPLQQHIGSPATPAVRRGQQVAKGELLATKLMRRYTRDPFAGSRSMGIPAAFMVDTMSMATDRLYVRLSGCLQGSPGQVHLPSETRSQ